MYLSVCKSVHEKLAAGKCPWCGRAVFHGRAGPPSWVSERRLVRFEFQGGERDGQVVAGRPSEAAIQSPLSILLYLTEGGRVGARFSDALTLEVIEKVRQSLEQNDLQTASGLFCPTYEVVHREERPEVLLIRLALADSD